MIDTIDITGSTPVYEAQRFLRTLHIDSKGKIPLVVPDGIYGPQTRAAVEKFQQLYGLPVSGEIDFDTWNKLYSEYQKSLERSGKAIPLYLFPDAPEYVTIMGERSDIVAIIQFVLRTLANIYGGLRGFPPSGVYDEATANDIKNFQLVHRLPPTGFVDRATWNMLADAYNRAQQIEN